MSGVTLVSDDAFKPDEKNVGHLHQFEQKNLSTLASFPWCAPVLLKNFATENMLETTGTYTSEGKTYFALAVRVPSGKRCSPTLFITTMSTTAAAV